MVSVKIFELLQIHPFLDRHEFRHGILAISIFTERSHVFPPNSCWVTMGFRI